jgi:hypothetical protein
MVVAGPILYTSLYESPCSGPLSANRDKRRADERTRTADLISLGVSSSTVERGARSSVLSSRQLYLPSAISQDGVEGQLRQFRVFGVARYCCTIPTNHVQTRRLYTSWSVLTAHDVVKGRNF